ncbi:uncharacterized protein LOC111385730 [Olea europaea var. sylvestris]|uniref:uncharacterized protein LOC111385730 n=1 Tax=Olea europaea var. sylvestris TaxID=158386 RepID=UPI000C1D4222|nr:uncharacterized protein LOC111385730 [Olea europaea var. sylvestris]
MAANYISTSMFSYTPNQVPIFEGEHFDYWSSQMETLFISQDLWEVVEDGFPEPDDNEEEEEEWTEAQQKDYKKNLRRDASALRFIQQGLSKTIYPRIHGVKRANGKKAEEYLPKEEEVLSKEEENHHEDKEDHFEEEEKEEHKATNQKTMTEIQIVKLEMQIFFAKFAENQIMKQMIASTNARDAEILTTLKEIVIIRTKQAPRTWNSKIDGYFLKNGFHRSPNEPSLYVKKQDHDFLIVCIYVDDLIYTGTNIRLVEDFKRKMMNEFEMTDLGVMKYFLAIQVKQSKGEIFISQEKYTEDLLKKFHMENCKSVSTPMAANDKLRKDDGAKKIDAKLFRSLVGSLIYLTNTRPILFKS